MNAFERAVDAIARLAGAVAAVSVLLMMLIVGYGVVLRYGFGQPQVWTDELVAYLVVLAVMLAAAEVLRRGEHISIDLLTERLGARARRGIDIAGMIAVIALSAVLVVSGYDMAAFSQSMGIRSTGHLATPEWIPQAALPLGYGLLALAALSRLLRLLAGRDGG